MLDFQNNGFTRNEVMKNILNWHTLWLEEQKKQDKAPPVYGKYKINIKTNVFSGEYCIYSSKIRGLCLMKLSFGFFFFQIINFFIGYRDYCNTFYPLMMLELWSSVFRDYVEKGNFIISKN